MRLIIGEQKQIESPLKDQRVFVKSPNGYSRIDSIITKPSIMDPKRNVVAKLSHFCDVNMMNNSIPVQDFTCTEFDYGSGEVLGYYSSVVGGLGNLPHSTVPDNFVDHMGKRSHENLPIFKNARISEHEVSEGYLKNNKNVLFDSEFIEDQLNMPFESINGMMITLSAISNIAIPINCFIVIDSKFGISIKNPKVINDPQLKELTGKQLKKYFRVFNKSFQIFKRDCSKHGNHIRIMAFAHAFGLAVEISNAEFPSYKITKNYNMSDHQRLLSLANALSRSGYDESDYANEFIRSGFPSLSSQTPMFEEERRSFLNGMMGNYYSCSYPHKFT